jgi:putative DNA primase/helicase
MRLEEAIASIGMTPPRSIPEGRWVRFPGIGKGRSNRAGWCRRISPTLAVFGDWSSGLTETWKDDAHRDDETSRRLLAETRQRQREFSEQQARKQQQVARQAQELIARATLLTHPYLVRKGFPTTPGLVRDTKLLIPVRDVRDYGRVMSVQEIGAAGEKRFLPGGKTRGGIYRIGAVPAEARRVALCEGFATGLSISAALHRLPGSHSVVVCFSAYNLQLVAEHFPKAIVCADHDESGTGAMAAHATGLPWTQPADVGTDFNDLHQARGLHAVTEALRELF